jgi:hypothetical protein
MLFFDFVIKNKLAAVALIRWVQKRDKRQKLRKLSTKKEAPSGRLLHLGYNREPG